MPAPQERSDHGSRQSMSAICNRCHYVTLSLQRPSGLSIPDALLNVACTANAHRIDTQLSEGCTCACTHACCVDKKYHAHFMKGPKGKIKDYAQFEGVCNLLLRLYCHARTHGATQAQTASGVSHCSARVFWFLPRIFLQASRLGLVIAGCHVQKQQAE